MDKGPWKVRDGKVGSDDFDHDVVVTFTGDFAGIDDRRAYAEWLCEVLNAASEKKRGENPS